MWMKRQAGVAAAATLLVLAAASCSSGPKPNADLAGARTLIAEAEQSGAQRYASLNLEAARSELRQADQDATSDKPVLAQRKAQEASADAELALARTRSAKAEQALREVDTGTATLRSESERQSSTPPMPMPPPPAAQPSQYQ
jgi:hypothetical protein